MHRSLTLSLILFISLSSMKFVPFDMCRGPLRRLRASDLMELASTGAHFLKFCVPHLNWGFPPNVNELFQCSRRILSATCMSAQLHYAYNGDNSCTLKSCRGPFPIVQNFLYAITNLSEPNGLFKSVKDPTKRASYKRKCFAVAAEMIQCAERTNICVPKSITSFLQFASTTFSKIVATW